MQKENRIYGLIEMTMLAVGVFATITLLAFTVRLGYLTNVLGVDTVSLSVTNSSPNIGTIITPDAQIDCGQDCFASYSPGSRVSFRSHTNNGYEVSSWLFQTETKQLGCVSRTENSCEIVIPEESFTLSVNWRPSRYYLTVAKAGDGQGVVSGPGLNCGVDCQTSWPSDQEIQIRAIADQGSKFIGWDSSATDCDSEGAAELCSLDKDTNQGTRTAVARFELIEQAVEIPEAEAPAKPTLNPIVLRDAEGNIVEWSDDNPAVFEPGEPIKLESTSEPGTIVRLFIFSEPQEVVITADKGGLWSYTIEQIAAGDHRVEAELENPDTGETTDRQQVLRFSVADETPEQPAETSESQTEPFRWIVVLFQVILPLVVLLALVLSYKRVVRSRPLK